MGLYWVRPWQLPESGREITTIYLARPGNSRVWSKTIARKNTWSFLILFLRDSKPKNARSVPALNSRSPHWNKAINGYRSP